MVKSYIECLYQKIDDHIAEQRKAYEDGDDGDDKNHNFDVIMAHQEEINKLYIMINDTRSRAMKQVCFNQLMVANSCKDGRKSDTMKDYVFLTINPPDQLPYTDLVRAVKQFTNLAVCKWAYYAFEQRGEKTDDYHGFHAHILFARDRKPYEVTKEIHRIFLPVVPDINKINLWSSSKQTDVEKSLEYILGRKKNVEKMEKAVNNTNMRTSYCLDPIYTVGTPPITC